MSRAPLVSILSMSVTAGRTTCYVADHRHYGHERLRSIGERGIHSPADKGRVALGQLRSGWQSARLHMGDGMVLTHLLPS